MASPDFIPADQVDPSQFAPEQPDFVPAAEAPALLSEREYLVQLPRNRIVDEYRQAKASGQPVDEAAYRDAYTARAREGNLTGDKDLRPDAPASPGLLTRGYEIGKSMFEGLFSQVNEVGKAAAGLPGQATARKLSGQREISPEEQRQAFGNVMQGVELGSVQSLNMLRQFAINTANKFFRGLQDEPAQRKAFDEQFDADVQVREAEDRVRAGGSIFSPQSIASLGGAAAKPVGDPETIQAVSQSPLADPSIFIPGTVAVKALKGPVQAFKALELAPGLERSAVRTALARPAEIAANLVRTAQTTIDTSPVVRAAVASGATLAAGGDTSLAVLAGLIGADVPKLGLAQKGLGALEANLRKTSAQIAGRLPPGPMSQFAGRAYAAMAPEGKALIASQMANLPFAMGAESEEDFQNAVLTGVMAHGAFSGAHKAVSGLNLSRSFWSPRDTPPSERMPVKDYGIDEGLDSEHRAVLSRINNDGANFVQTIRNWFGKTGDRGELYAVSRKGFAEALGRFAEQGASWVDETGQKHAFDPAFVKDAAEQNGVTLEVADPKEPGKTRKVALFAVDDGVPGLGAGHESGHLLEFLLSPEEKAAAYDTIRQMYGPEEIKKARAYYLQLLDQSREQNGQPRAASEMSDERVLSELFAEHVAGRLNSIPVGAFGPSGEHTFKNPAWRKGINKLTAMMERALNAAGIAIPETAEVRTFRDSEGRTYEKYVPAGKGVQSGLGFELSSPVGVIVDNFLESKRLDHEIEKAQVAGEKTPAAEVIQNSRPIAPEPGFKKGDPIGEVKASDGTVVGKKAVVSKVLGETDGVQYYEIEYTDPVDGQRKAGNVPESFLQSPVSDKATSEAKPKTPAEPFPKSPVTSETPPGAATAESLVPPKQVANVTRPEAEAPVAPAAPPKEDATNLRATAAQQDTFAKKASPEVQAHNLGVLKEATDKPRAEVPVMETDYYAAKSQVFSPDAVVRKEQRRLADKAEQEGQPNPLRKIYQKLFVPYKLLGGPRPRVFGFSLDKLVQNIDILKGWAIEKGDTKLVARLSDSRFANSVRQYLENQSNGYAGDGRKLVRPADTKPGTVTPENPDYIPTKLSELEARTINFLLGLPLPESSTPANRYFARFARENGLEPSMYNSGTEETNPVRRDFIEKGFDPKLLNSVVENLPVENFTTPLKPRPDLKFTAGDTAFAQAGFMPQTLNIGLHVKDGEPNSVEHVLGVLKKNGLVPEKYEVKQSGTEPTLVARIAGASDETIAKVSDELKQDAIAVQNDDGTGKLLGPRAADWGEFNPDFFLPLTQTEAERGDKGLYRESDFKRRRITGGSYIELMNDAAKFMPRSPVQHGGEVLEHSLGDKTLNLVHFGGTGLKEVDPAQFGKSGLTTSSELSGLPRSYFYVQNKTNKGDPVVNRKNYYGAKVSGSRIYDGDKDPLNYAAQINREKADQMLIDAGYTGISRSRGKYQQVELFEPTKVEPIDSPTAKFMPKASPAVEKALKDSKVRDGDGNLLPLFHGTYSDFKKFGKGDLGYHFGTHEAANARIGKAIADLTGGEVPAEKGFDAFPELRENTPPGARGALEGVAEGARTIPVFLDIKNPLRMRDVGPWDNPEEVLFALPKAALKRLPESVGKVVDEYVAKQNDYTGPTSKYNDFKERTAVKPLAAIREGLQSLGYDGIVYRNEFEGSKAAQLRAAMIPFDESKTPDSYIAFDNKQIVPAFDATAKARWMPKTAAPGEGLQDIRDTRPYKQIVKHLTPKEAEKIRSDVATEMVSLYETFPKDEDFESAAKAGIAKKGWYRRAADSIKFIFGEDTDKFVALLAAMSPQQSVQENLHMSLKTWADWQEAGRPLDTASLTEIVERHADIHARVPNSVRALQGYEAAEPVSKFLEEGAHLSGLKVESFRRNLLGDFTPSTNDTWMAMFANIDQTVFAKKSGYLAFNAKIRKVAKKLGMEPAEVQETVWSFFKTLLDNTTVKRSAKETLRTLGESDILNTPEFHEELITNPKIKAQLERLGFTGFDALRDRENSGRAVPRAGSLASIALEEGGRGRLRVLDRIAGRAQRLKDLQEAGTKAAVQPADLPENPF